MATVATLKDRYTEVTQRVAEAAKRAGRSPADVLVVAVTKYAEPEQVRELIQLGHMDFGENKVQQLAQRAAMAQEFLERSISLRDSGGVPTSANLPESVRWHMIGRLQRNKVRKAIECARLIHGVDSLRLAEEIQAIALKRDVTVDILLQVNCSGEKTKGGVAPPAARHLAEQIDTMVNVRLRGLMTMAPHSDNPEDSRFTFTQCRELFEDLRAYNLAEGAFNILSMGMTGDYEVAISEGANVVRIGSALFGEPAEHTPDDDDDGEDEGEE
ncbi:MAG: YggS family pyridoxal phosphate-dependent enzyme [Phycisphaerales bacterium]|nr:MAG: YggS family pyridoxal phosphate-dependent enzyme [Phycisphaerales bacterium]